MAALTDACILRLAISDNSTLRELKHSATLQTRWQIRSHQVTTSGLTYDAQSNVNSCLLRYFYIPPCTTCYRFKELSKKVQSKFSWFKVAWRSPFKVLQRVLLKPHVQLP